MYRLPSSSGAASSESLYATKAQLNDLDRSRDETIILRGAELSAAVVATEAAQASLISRLES